MKWLDCSGSVQSGQYESVRSIQPDVAAKLVAATLKHQKTKAKNSAKKVFFIKKTLVEQDNRNIISNNLQLTIK